VNVHFTDLAWQDYQHWLLWLRHDADALGRVNKLIEDARRRPFVGLAKPEPLKGDLAGWRSRRITGEHRLIYRIAGKRGGDQRIEVVSCRYHYRHGRS
jgi:toxin YoeB